MSRLFTDAVFSQDIRAIQLIVNRLDGGLPRDDQVDMYQTEFGDCLTAVLEMDNAERLKVMPEDTTLMAMAKSLFDIACEDIYFDRKKAKPILSPTVERKNCRDQAMRMILDRVGGRKTKVEIHEEPTAIETADWLGALTDGSENFDECPAQ